MEFVLSQECRRNADGSLDDGYVNDADDPGGETKYGISKRAYPNEDIKNLTLARALELYFRDYWLKSGCDKLTYPLNAVVMDCAVSQGVGRAKQLLDKTNNPTEFIKERRIKYVVTIDRNPKLAKFKNFWFKRLNNLQKLVDCAVN